MSKKIDLSEAKIISVEEEKNENGCKIQKTVFELPLSKIIEQYSKAEIEQAHRNFMNIKFLLENLDSDTDTVDSEDDL